MVQIAIATVAAASAVSPMFYEASTAASTLTFEPVGQAVPRSSSQFDNAAQMNTLLGSTGLINVPTAFVAVEDTAKFGAAFSEDVSAPSVAWGIVESVEVSGAYVDSDGGSDELIANAKVSIVPQNFDWLVVGVGIIDAFDAIDDTLYFVASANLIVPDEVDDEVFGLRVHAGAGTGMFNEELFAGAEFLLDDDFTLIGEWDANDLNFALRYIHNEEFGVQAGTLGDSLYISSTYRMRF